MYKNRLKYFIDRFDVTKRSLAKILNISESCYNHYENEDDIMPIKHLNTLCTHFDVSIDYIFNFTNKKNYKNCKEQIDKELSGKRLKEFRKENNLTQVKLALLLHTVHPTIVNYEKGKNIIATPFLYQICKKYKISADYLLGKIDEPKYLK